MFTPSLNRRVAALEAHSSKCDGFTDLSDTELMRRILRLHFEREPTAEEIHEWLTLPARESERRFREMLAEVRRQLQQPDGQEEAERGRA